MHRGWHRNEATGPVSINAPQAPDASKGPEAFLYLLARHRMNRSSRYGKFDAGSVLGFCHRTNRRLGTSVADVAAIPNTPTLEFADPRPPTWSSSGLLVSRGVGPRVRDLANGAG